MTLSEMTESPRTLLLSGLDGLCEKALDSAESFKQQAIISVAELTRGSNGRISAELVEANQYATHGLAWLATYVEALRETLNWSRALSSEGKFGELEQLILQAGFSEYLSQIAGGIPMTLGEIIRPLDLGLDDAAIAKYKTAEVATLIEAGHSASVKERIAELIAEGMDTGDFGDLGLDETFAMIRDQFRRFANEEVMPYAHDWHLKDELIPMPVVQKMSELGVFGLTVPEEYDGLGLGKMSMCVVSEELSRGYIGVGSLGTRSEIAAELILTGGTEAQKDKWLSSIATGAILPTAVFTEPNTGSDLASLKTRA
ncbi:acyl-CoA dehydrogenase family protein, partial [uncultured Sneathiella sp.]